MGSGVLLFIAGVILGAAAVGIVVCAAVDFAKGNKG